MKFTSKRLVKPGFTIIELIVVIAVIGILATIVIVAYGNIQGQARDKSVQSDLDSLDGIETDIGIKNNSAVDWYSGNGLDASLNFVPSPGNIIDVVANGTDYCIRGYNPAGTKKTIYNAFIKESSPGICGNLPPSSQAIGGSQTCQSIPNAVCVSTFAGSSWGRADGTGTSAQFGLPSGIVEDSSGNFYVADYGNNNIRKITPAGVVTTLAGPSDGSSGYTNGTGSVALFSNPWGLAIDSAGNLYIADSSNNCIRKVTPAGVVTTFAGSATGLPGYADGTGTSALFDFPDAVAVDSSGNVYVADADNYLVRKITPAGVVSTVAGSSRGYTDGPAMSAAFGSVSGIAVDSSGTVYLADSDNNAIRKLTTAGVVSTLAGGGGYGYVDGTGTSAQFDYPCGVTLGPGGVIYVTDQDNNMIREVTQAGVVTTLAGSGSAGSADGVSTSASFYYPNASVVDPSGAVYVADFSSNRIRKIQ